MIYDVDYFIKKFEAIPEIKWRKGLLQDREGKRCANGHCGVTQDHLRFGAFPEEAIGLQRVFSILTEVGWEDLSGNYSNKAAAINNGVCPRYQQPTPKQRILAALYDIKVMQQPEVKRERIVYVTVDPSIKEQATELIMS